VQSGVVESLRSDFAAGADVVARDPATGSTLLHYAAEHGYTAVAEILLEHGADPNDKNKEGQRPLDVTRSKAMKALLKKHGAVTGKGKKKSPAKPAKKTTKKAVGKTTRTKSSAKPGKKVKKIAKPTRNRARKKTKAD